MFFLASVFSLPSCSSNDDEVIKEKDKEEEAVDDKWELVWSETFEKDGMIDTKDWNYHEGGIYNNEKQTYPSGSKDNVRIENGVLVLEAHKVGDGYTSGYINTKGKHSLTYGKIEVAARLPKGKGVWPAIWMMPDEDNYGIWPRSGEIDIMEFVGFQPGIIHSTVHTESFNHTLNNEPKMQTKVEDLHADFTKFGVEWTPTEIKILINNKVVNTFVNKNVGDANDTKVWPFNKPFHLILNLAIGGDWGGAQGIDDSIFPQKMEIQSVKMYQLAKN